jgi:hypothetical protein
MKTLYLYLLLLVAWNPLAPHMADLHPQSLREFAVAA